MTQNCHEQQNQNNHNHKCHQHGKGHGIMMVLCIAAALLAMVFLPKLGRPFGLIAVLICPIMHLFMMKSMFKKDGS